MIKVYCIKCGALLVELRSLAEIKIVCHKCGFTNEIETILGMFLTQKELNRVGWKILGQVGGNFET